MDQFHKPLRKSVEKWNILPLSPQLKYLTRIRETSWANALLLNYPSIFPLDLWGFSREVPSFEIIAGFKGLFSFPKQNSLKCSSDQKTKIHYICSKYKSDLLKWINYHGSAGCQKICAFHVHTCALYHACSPLTALCHEFNTSLWRYSNYLYWEGDIRLTCDTHQHWTLIVSNYPTFIQNR